MEELDILQLLIVFAVILVAAKASGILAVRLGQPAVLGELSAGVLLGPSVLDLFGPDLGSVKPSGPGRASTQFKKGNPGKQKGTKTKITVAQRDTARQIFAPLADRAIEKGEEHLNNCELKAGEVCMNCQFWAKISIEYAYGKPSQPIEIDPVALRAELESIAALAGKSVEEIEAEAAEVGVRVMADYRGATAR